MLNDILYIESLQNYVCLHTCQEKIITYTALKNILELLPDDFLQIHKSYIVDLKQISSTDSFSVFVMDIGLPIGNTFKNAFF